VQKPQRWWPPASERTAGSSESQSSVSTDCSRLWTSAAPLSGWHKQTLAQHVLRLLCYARDLYQSCLATPQLMRYALQAGELADIHRHQGNRAKIVQPSVWLFRQTVQCAVTNTDLDDPDTSLPGALNACSEQQCKHRLAAVDLLRLVVLFGSLETLQWCTASVLKQAGALPSLITRQALRFCAASRGGVRILAWLQQARLLEFEWQNAHGARWALTDTAAEQGRVQTVQLLPLAWCVRL